MKASPSTLRQGETPLRPLSLVLGMVEEGESFSMRYVLLPRCNREPADANPDPPSSQAPALLHASQAEVCERERERDRGGLIEVDPDAYEFFVCGGRWKKEYWSGYRDGEDDGVAGEVDLATAPRGDGCGGFNEMEVRRAVWGLSRDNRMRL